MIKLFKNANIYDKGEFKKASFIADENGGHLAEESEVAPLLSAISENEAADLNGSYIFPGFTDVHVHFREPGFIYKETIATGSRAAAHGGYTDVMTMPNLSPVPDSLENLRPQLEKIESDAVIGVHPYGAITIGEKGEELSDIDGLSPYVCGFSDDGRGVQNPEIMKKAMLAAKKNGKLIVAHCEDNSLLHGGYIHDGEYARAHRHKGISSESEWKQIERDIALARETGSSYHVCHISAKESVALIREAKKDGVDITCETAPHYLVLTDADLKEEGRFKMNPPLRSEADREALIEGILDGTVDMIATDHAPHSREEKSRGLEKSAFGITGIELAFPLLYTFLVKKGIISLEKLIYLLAEAPRKRFNIPNSGFTCFDLSQSFTVDEDFFLSMGKSTPFLGESLNGVCKFTYYNGERVY